MPHLFAGRLFTPYSSFAARRSDSAGELTHLSESQVGRRGHSSVPFQTNNFAYQWMSSVFKLFDFNEFLLRWRQLLRFFLQLVLNETLKPRIYKANVGEYHVIN